MFLTFDNESKIGFKNRKENYFFYFLSSNKKNFSYKMCLAITSKSKTDFQNKMVLLKQETELFLLFPELQ